MHVTRPPRRKSPQKYRARRAALARVSKREKRASSRFWNPTGFLQLVRQTCFKLDAPRHAPHRKAWVQGRQDLDSRKIDEKLRGCLHECLRSAPEYRKQIETSGRTRRANCTDYRRWHGKKGGNWSATSVANSTPRAASFGKTACSLAAQRAAQLAAQLVSPIHITWHGSSSSSVSTLTLLPFRSPRDSCRGRGSASSSPRDSCRVRGSMSATRRSYTGSSGSSG